MKSKIIEANGVNGQMKLGEGYVEISKKGVLGFMTQGFKGVKKIAIKQITSIQFKNAGTFTNGYMQIAFIGGQESKGGLFNATQDENTVVFNKKQQSDFERIKEKIELIIYK